MNSKATRQPVLLYVVVAALLLWLAIATINDLRTMDPNAGYGDRDAYYARINEAPDTGPAGRTLGD